MTLISGTRLGPYEIQSPLGSGGMGEVYRALDTRLDRIVAIKILPSRLSEDPEAKERFDREARTISSLNHPNIYILQIRGRVKSVDLKEIVHHRVGPKAARDQFRPVSGKGLRPTRPLELFQIDHTPVDVIVVDEIDRRSERIDQNSLLNMTNSPLLSMAEDAGVPV
jgi:serine/threonine protein kinase